jgi:hypothetical protein
MYKLIGGHQLKPYHLYSWNKNKTSVPLDKFVAVSNPLEHRAHVVDAIDKIGLAGDVGAKLKQFAQRSIDLEIVVWSGVPGEFMCPAEVKGCDVPTIMWDPYLTFPYFSRDLSNPGEAKWGQGLEKIVMKPAVMPAYMILGHEIGHYCHWATQKSWFEQALKDGDIAAIEARNLKDHERPMLRSLSLPPRLSYQDFRGGANDPKKSTSKHITSGGVHNTNMQSCYNLSNSMTIASAALSSEIRKAERKQQDKVNKLRSERARQPTRNVAVTCTICHAQFRSKMTYNSHIKPIFGAPCPAERMD